MKTPNKIIISRTDAIGDVVLTLPMASLLKKTFPHCKIIFLGSAYTKDVVACCSDVDEFIVFDEEKLNEIGADTIVHVFPNKAIAATAKKVGIKNRIGTSHRWYNWFMCNKLINVSRKKSDLHEAQLNLKLAACFDQVKDLYTYDEVLNLINFEAKPTSTANINLIDNDKFNLIIHPKSKGSAREWGLHNFSTLISLLPKDRFKIFICGTEQEGVAIRDAFADAVQLGDAVDLTGTMSLSDYIYFISKADGLIAASTGPLHIAAALGRNAIGIYPPIRPMHPGRWACVGQKTKVFVADKECNNCRKGGKCSCMEKVSPQDVRDYLMAICR